MGLLNPRARCPRCKGKIHVGWVTRSAPLVCQHCGAELEGSDALATLRVKGEPNPWKQLSGSTGIGTRAERKQKARAQRAEYARNKAVRDQARKEPDVIEAHANADTWLRRGDKEKSKAWREHAYHLEEQHMRRIEKAANRER